MPAIITPQKIGRLTSTSEKRPLIIKTLTQFLLNRLGDGDIPQKWDCELQLLKRSMS
jgi:hypothetical protein